MTHNSDTSCNKCFSFDTFFTLLSPSLFFVFGFIQFDFVSTCFDFVIKCKNGFVLNLVIFAGEKS